MARVRQARRCAASKTNGEPCHAWAVIGAAVCWSHGGAAPQVQHAAYVALVEAAIRRQFEAEWARYRKRRARWEQERARAAARLLGIPLAEVHDGHVLWASAAYDDPVFKRPPPRMRHDRRFKVPEPPTRAPGRTPQ